MTTSVAAELLVVRKRSSTWILLGIWSVLAVLFAYVIPYVEYLNGSGPGNRSLEDLLPDRLVGNLLAGFPFFGGVFALMLGVLALGSEYGWGTLKTLFSQRPGRLQVFGAKLIALGLVLVPFVFTAFALGAGASYAIAVREGADVAWPSASLILRALGAGWFLLAVWATFGILLGVASRGTSLAIGVGILYALVIEGLISAFADSVSFLEPLTKFFLRANGYSLVKGLGVSTVDVAGNGPGAFSGPYVGSAQALIVLALYALGFLLVSGFLLRRRDVA
ncbi:MAG TPA: ABC transporter permease subunit [Gaiellaceae bacterium]|jgi:ABC-type transport system involved in multi-copper enzyme maturation permease subunit|nr:ABC transporter permease subunit [Gaiellaceae bacterium]